MTSLGEILEDILIENMESVWLEEGRPLMASPNKSGLDKKVFKREEDFIPTSEDICEFAFEMMSVDGDIEVFGQESFASNYTYLYSDKILFRVSFRRFKNKYSIRLKKYNFSQLKIIPFIK